MVNDQFGVKKIYPDSTSNPMSWYLTGANDSRTKEGGDLGGVNFSNGVISWDSGNDKARFNVYTTQGYTGSKINKNHAQCASRGYMMDPKDWKNIEMTAYVKVDAGSDDQFVMYARGGTHTGSGNCEGFAYKADLYYSGRTRFAKEQYHVSYAFTGSKTAMGSIEGKWVGMKFCMYNKGGNAQTGEGADVVLEIWLDKNANNTWEKVDSYVDSGGFGDDGAKCGGSDDQIGTWGGPNATYRWDAANSVEMKSCSVREINPQGVFNEGGSNSCAAIGTGGTGNTGSGSTAAGSPPPSSTSTGSGGVMDSWGVKSCYGTGLVDTTPERDFRSSSFRLDWIQIGQSNYRGIELTYYMKWPNPDDDEKSAQLGGGEHSDGSSPRCYSIGVDLRTGATRFRFEEDHPDYEDGQTGPRGTPMGSRFVGTKYIKRNQGNGVLIEIWQDTGDNEGSRPANAWRKVVSWIDREKNWQNPPKDHMALARWDGSNGDNAQYKWPSIREIKDTDPTTPFTGSGGTTSPPPSSGGGSGGNNCGGDGTDNNNGGGNGGSDGSGDSGSGGGSQIPEPPPIFTIYVDRSFMFNVGVDTDDNCTQGLPQMAVEPKSIWNVQGETLVYQDLGYNTLGGASEVGEIIMSADSLLYGEIIKKVKVNSIHRTVAADLSTCSGMLYCKLINSRDGLTRVIFGGGQNVAGIDVNQQALEFEQSNNKYKCVVGDMIVLQYLDASAGPTKCLKVKHTTKDTLDNVATQMVIKTSTGYKVTEHKDKDVGFEIFVADIK